MTESIFEVGGAVSSILGPGRDHGEKNSNKAGAAFRAQLAGVMISLTVAGVAESPNWAERSLRVTAKINTVE